MRTYADYLFSLTVKELTSILRQSAVTGYSKLRKAELLETVYGLSEVAEVEATEHDATLNEAYGQHVSSNGLHFPSYLADRRRHVLNDDIKIGEFWNCCVANPAKVIVFDDGARQAVCEMHATLYPGKVQSLPNGKIIKCDNCAHTYLKVVIAPFVGDVVRIDDIGILGTVERIDTYPDMTVYGVRTLNGTMFAREGWEISYVPQDDVHEFRTAEIRAQAARQQAGTTPQDLLRKVLDFNDRIANQAAEIMRTLPESDSDYSAYVQIHKDARKAQQEATHTLSLI